jgi:glycosyltransferase involved in cell wall biosynthesis
MHPSHHGIHLFERISAVEEGNMRIIHLLLGKANPNTMMGVNKVVHHLATQQFRAGYEVEVWGITETPQEIGHQHDYPLILFESVRTRFSLSRALRDVLQSLQPKDIVHMHSVFLPELYSASRVLRSNSVPWVISPHGGYAQESMKKNWLAKRVYIALFETTLLSQARAAHAISATEVEDINRLCRPQRVVLIPNGQDLLEVEFTPDPLPAVERPVFGFCGRLEARVKGLDLLIDGFACYTKQGGKGKLWLIGDGKDKERLRTQAQNLGIADKVEFLGPKFGNEKLNLIAQMDVFVHTSRWDAVPTAILEAAALCRPLLISEETNVGSYVSKHNAGLVLFKNMPDSIAQGMRSYKDILNSGRLSEIGLNARRMIEKDFGWTRIASELVKVYCE